jgi:hypothetical protein
VAVAGDVLAGLEDVPWGRFEPADPDHPVAALPRALRRLLDQGEKATEKDCHPLYGMLFHGSAEATAAVSAAAAPFVAALAAEPGNGARVDLVETLAGMLSRAVEAQAEPLAADGWPAAWRPYERDVLALLVHQDRDVRRAALALARTAAPLLERWRAEADPAVRVTVLLALGEAAAVAGPGAVEEIRAVLAEALRSADPVTQVAAVHASAALDPDLPVRKADLLLRLLSDPAAGPDFEAVWYEPGAAAPSERESVVHRTGALLDRDPRAARSFAVRLAEAAHRDQDGPLCAAALDEAWRQLVLRPSAGPDLLPLAGGLLAARDPAVRLRAVHLLAMLGKSAAPYADRLADLLDDRGEAECVDGRVGDFACWALARIGDPRAVPGIVERFRAFDEEFRSGSWVLENVRLPALSELLIPMREYAGVLLPALRNLLREEAAGGAWSLAGSALRVFEEWGEEALPALPEILPLLGDARYSLSAADVLVAMGPGAAPAEQALRDCTVLDHPANHLKVAWAAWRLGGDGASVLERVGEAVLAAEPPLCGPVWWLTDFGPVAAPYAGRVRYFMDTAQGWGRLQAALAWWAITGDHELSLPVAEDFVREMAAGGDRYGLYAEALRILTRIGTTTPATRTALTETASTDRRLSDERDYQALLQDEHLRTAITAVLALRPA